MHDTHHALTTSHGLIVEDVMTPRWIGFALARRVRWRCRGCGKDRCTWVTQGGRPMHPAEVDREYGWQAMRVMGDEVYSYGPEDRTFFGLAVVACGQCSESAVLSQHATWRIGYERSRFDLLAAMSATTEQERIAALRRLPEADRRDLPLFPLPPSEQWPPTD